MLMNLLLLDVMSNWAAIFSTSGVGSTPGKSTKKMGTVLEVSANVSIMSNGGCSTNLSPIFSDTNMVNADGSLSGLMALRRSSFWNLLDSLNS